MEIQHKHEGHQGLFFIQDQDDVVAELDYVDEDHDLVMSINHTEVKKERAGRGMGLKLVRAAVDFARKNHKLITPRCSYVKSVFMRKPEWSDVLS